jgi:hypothetical protein
LELTPAKILQIGRELLQGVQETMMKVSRSSWKACSRDLIIFSDYKRSEGSSMLFRGGKIKARILQQTH